MTAVVARNECVPGYDFAFTRFDPEFDVLFLLIDNQQELDGKHIASFEIGSNSMVAERMIFLARFQDRSMAIYMALTPAFKPIRLDIPIEPN